VPLSDGAQPRYAHAQLSVPVNIPWSGINLIAETEKTWRRTNSTEHISCCGGVLRSGTANRCKATNRFSNNLSPEVELYQAFDAPRLKLVQREKTTGLTPPCRDDATSGRRSG